jgi:hypothetical protein
MPTTDNELPSLPHPRRDNEDPKEEKSHTEMLLPIRAKHLRAIEDPNWAMPRTDTLCKLAEDRLAIPKTANDEPSRLQLLSDNEDPSVE